VVARSEIGRIEDELQLAAPPPELNKLVSEADPRLYLKTVAETVREHLSNARQALESTALLRLLFDWYSGAAVEQTWLNIHRAAEALLMIQSSATVTSAFVEIDAAFRATIKPDDARFKELNYALSEIEEVLLKKQRPAELGAVLRAKLLAVLHSVNAASDTAHETVRQWRNLLLIGGFALATLSGALAIMHAFVPTFLSLTPTTNPTATVKQVGDAIEPWQVELIGSVGGALAAVLALNRFSGFTDPAGLPVTQALLRIPTAAVTGLVGVVLMQTSTLGLLKAQNGTTVLAYAFLFGYAQEPLLRMIDRQAGKVLDPARAKDEPVKPIPPAPSPARPTHHMPRNPGSSGDDTEG
jgi:hypothetical protein